MKTPSIRWKLLLPTMTLAIFAAAILVGFQYSRTRDQLLRQLDRTLVTKSEEVHSVLRSGASVEELGSFLEVETVYSSSPYEYFYEIESDGITLLSSRNLRGEHLVGESTADSVHRADQPHPHRAGESLLVRDEPLLAEFPGWQSARVWIGVSLGPLESTMRTEWIQSSLAALGGLIALFTTLWLVMGRTLRRVAAISRRATSITSTNLRERLPVNGNGDELDELSSVFNEMLTGLGRSLEQMESFTSDAAHQLRTPLTRVRGELDLILRDGNGVPEPIRLRLKDTRQELERLSRTCSRLLLLARLDRGALGEDLLVDDIDLSVLVEDIVEQVGPSAAERAVEVRYVHRAGVHVRCSRPLLVEALLNLLDNALRFSPNGTAIEVSLRCTENEVFVSIADQGPGVPDHLREKVFRRFFRHATTPGDSGTGLGLAIVRGIARAHGGDAHIETSAGGRSAFVLTLPVSGKALIDISSRTQLNHAV